jgi:hypothetical protein
VPHVIARSPLTTIPPQVTASVGDRLMKTFELVDTLIVFAAGARES